MVCWYRLLLISHLAPWRALSPQNTQCLGHCLKEQQAQFGGIATASPCSSGCVTQVEGNHKWPEQALCLPHGITTTQCHFRDITHHTKFLPQTKHGPNWPTKVPTWVERTHMGGEALLCFKTMQVLLQLREMAVKGRVSPSLLQTDIKISLDEKSLGLLLCLTAF